MTALYPNLKVNKNGIEDKFIARMPNLQILIVPDSNHTGYKSNEVVQFFLDLFQPKKLLRKYRTANRTLDIHNVIKTELLESKEPEKPYTSPLKPGPVSRS